MKFISGASSNHFKTLLQFINSFLSYNNNYVLIVYNLGLKDFQLNELEKLIKNHNNITYKNFKYNEYPSYFNINVNAGEYAWKPVIIYEESKNFNDNLIWLDSGTLLTDSLDTFKNIIDNNYIYSPSSEGTIKEWSFKETYKIMNFYDINLSMRTAGVVCFNCRIEWVRDLLKEWNKFALIKDCISPEGSSRNNHRQDQTIFSILYHKYQKVHKFKIIDHFLSFTVQNDIG
jgi:hypothetical protein